MVKECDDRLTIKYLIFNWKKQILEESLEDNTKRE